MLVPRSRILYFEGTPSVEIDLYKDVIRNNDYSAIDTAVDNQEAYALVWKLEHYCQTWLGIPFGCIEEHLVTQCRYPLRDAQRKIGNLIASAIRSVLDIDPRTVAFMLGGSTTPDFIREIIIAADRGLPAVGGAIAQDDGNYPLLCKLMATPL